MVARARGARPRPASARAVRAAIAACVLALGAAAALANRPAGGDGGVRADPAPPLFGPAYVRPVERRLTAAEDHGHRLARAWLSDHPGAAPAVFAAFVEASLPPPPPAAVEAREIAGLRRVTAARTPAGDEAARWLERYGREGIWKLYGRQYRDLAPVAERARDRDALALALALAGEVTDAGKARFRRLSPYQRDPRVRGINASRFDGAPRYSYPSKHAVASAAAATLLGRLEPLRAREFRWMAAEIAYSRLYGGGHYPSDLTAGAAAGAMIGDYVLQRSDLR